MSVNGKLLPAKKGGTAVAKWQEQLAAQAEAAAKMEASTATGQFFSLKGGQLSFNDSPIPGNEMGVIIVDHILENVYYKERFDANNPVPPTCFAFGRADQEMVPHEVVVEKQHEACTGCPMNEWGTSDVGKGKACKNTRRLAMISAGQFNKAGEFDTIEDEEHYKEAQLAFLKLPITSVKGYAAYVKQLAAVLRRPPHGVYTKVSVVPDAKDQFKVVFTPIAPVPDELMPLIMERHEQASAQIDFPYQPETEEQAAARAAPQKRQVRKPVKAAVGKRF